jgi:hypothetical protein
MNKDVIYIDVEDDITAIISKVKASKEKIVALVPPKRIGILQSAVNLRLLTRSAQQHDKRLVLITNNHALMALAGQAKLPVARTLQSKPELPELTALKSDDDNDVIDGNDLPVGEHAKQASDDADDTIDIAAADISAAGLASASKAAAKPAAKAKSGVKVPNFNTFRKKMMLGIGGGILLLVFLVWAIFFAPHATITVSAKTNDSSVNTEVSANESASTDLDKKTIKSVTTKKSENKSADFVATGTKNVGNKATGTVSFSTSQISALGTTIPAGTQLVSSGGLSFVTDSSVTITINNYTNAPTTVTAVEQGAKFNAASGAMSGAPAGIDANLQGPTSGGTDKIAKVVTQADVQKAKQAIADETSDSKKNELKDMFKGDVKVIDESYDVAYDNVKITPDVGEEADSGNATITATVTYRLSAIEKSELHSFLSKYLKNQLQGTKNRRVFDDGSSKIQFQDVTLDKKTNTSKFTLIATAKIGPNLSVKQIKAQAKGKQFGDIQQSIQSIQGVEDVKVSFFPFWVNTVPGDDSKISVQFSVDE